MGTIRSVLFLLLSTALLALTACGGGGDSASNAGPSESTAISFKLNSYSADLSAPAAAPAGASQPQGTSTACTLPNGTPASVCGQLLVVPKGDPAGEAIYTFGIEIDPAKKQVTTVFRLPLPQDAYDIYVLITAGATQLGGYLPRWLVVGGGLNTITVTLNPILGGPLNSVKDLRVLAPLAVRYDPALVAAYLHPRIGVAVDGGPEYVFDVVADAADPVILLFLQPGDHLLNVRFFDGAILQDVSPEEGTPVTLEPPDQLGGTGEPPQVVVVPLSAEANYSYAPATGAGVGTFVFTVPSDVINEVGGLGGPADPLSGRLKAVASIVGPANDLLETELTLDPVYEPTSGAILHYTATLAIDGFTPGAVVWQLRFVDRRSGEEIGYCASEVTAGTDAVTYGCNLRLLVRALTAINPTGMLQVSVQDAAGQHAGAVVLLNGKPIGVTGSGTPGEVLGELVRFLRPGSYTLQVREQILDPYGSGNIISRESAVTTIAVTEGATTVLAITLAPFPFNAPAVSGTSPSNGVDGVPVDTSVSVTFTHAMLPGPSAAALTVTPVRPGALALAGSTSWSSDGTVLTFKPAGALEYLQAYTVRIASTALDTWGIALPADVTVTFTTGVQPDLTAPQLLSVSPGNGADINAVITVTFSEAMDTATLDSPANFSLTRSSDPNPVAGSKTWSGGNSVLIFKPQSAMGYGTEYTVTVGAGATDVAGNPLANPQQVSFRTGDAPDTTAPTVVATSPLGGATDVPVGSAIVVSFSEDMRTATVESSFNVAPATAGSFSWVGASQVRFTPAAPLLNDRDYSVTIGSTAQDLAGNGIAGGAVFGFRTAKAPPTGSVIELTPGRTVRPQRFDDSAHPVTSPLTVRVPPLESIRVMNDAGGRPLGDPDRFLLFLYLGKVKCIYLAGQWDRHIGGVAEELFEHAFKSPVCTGGRGVRAGSLVTVTPGDATGGDDDRDGERDDDERDHHATRGSEIRARVVAGNPRFPETRLLVTVEVVP